MKRKLAMMFAVMLSTCVLMSEVIGATEVERAVSGNDTAEEIVIEEPSEEIMIEEPSEELPEETPEETPEEPTEEVVVSAPAGGEIPEDAEIEVSEEEKKVSGGGALAIDGYFDDWEGVPETHISYRSHNTYEYHGGSILVSGGYVYVHVRMSDLYQQQIPVDDLKLTINGVERSFVIRKRNADNTVNWDPSVYSLSDGIHSDLGIFYRDGAYMALGEAAVTVSDASPNDSFEFRMKISELESLYSIEPGTIENGAKIEFFSPNLGPERITVMGTSTGTYIGILLCFAVVLSALIGQKRKQAHS